jgi:hypothetical protein
MYCRGWMLMGLVLVFVPALLARRNNKRVVVAENEEHHACSNMSYGPCVFKNGATCGVGRKLATPVDENCPKIQKQVHCKVPCVSHPTDCHYMKQRPSKTDRQSLCDAETNKYAVTMKLVSGDAAVCAPTKVAYRECRRRQVRAAGDKGNKKNGGRKQKQQSTEATTPTASVATKSSASECKYRKAKGPKGACDAVTNTRTVARQLKKNSPASCEPTKTFTEACRPTKPKQGGRKNSGRGAQ